MAAEQLPAELSRIEHMISDARSPEQLKHVLALADAAIAYAKRFYSEHKEIIQRARAAKLLAERRLGEMLKAMPKSRGAAGSAGPGRGNAVPIENRVCDTPTLSDLGIDKKVSARAQRIADLPPETFSAVMTGQIQVSQVLDAKRAPKRPVKTKAAQARKEAIEAAQANHVSMFAVYARKTLQEMRALTSWSDEELRLAEELAEECRRVAGKALSSLMLEP